MCLEKSCTNDKMRALIAFWKDSSMFFPKEVVDSGVKGSHSGGHCVGINQCKMRGEADTVWVS